MKLREIYTNSKYKCKIEIQDLLVKQIGIEKSLFLDKEYIAFKTKDKFKIIELVIQVVENNFKYDIVKDVHDEYHITVDLGENFIE